MSDDDLDTAVERADELAESLAVTLAPLSAATQSMVLAALLAQLLLRSPTGQREELLATHTDLVRLLVRSEERNFQ